MEKEQSKFNWTQIVMTVLISVFAIVSIIIISLAVLLVNFSKDVSDGASSVFSSMMDKNPELFLQIGDNPLNDDYLLGYTLLKSKDIELNGNFKARPLTKMERSLEKKDLTCIDEYEYVTAGYTSQTSTSDWHYLTVVNLSYLQQTKMTPIDVEQIARYNDLGCTEYGSDGTKSYLKCPLYNCEMIEVKREVPYGWAVDSLEVSSIKLD